jgi:hypothetical protein
MATLWQKAIVLEATQKMHCSGTSPFKLIRTLRIFKYLLEDMMALKANSQPKPSVASDLIEFPRTYHCLNFDSNFSTFRN